MTSLEHDWFPRPVPPNVKIGARGWVYSSYAFLHCKSLRSPGVEIGSDTGIYDGSFFELGPAGHVRIGDFSSIVGATIATNGELEIGSHTFIAHRVVIADRADPTPVRDALDESPPIRIGDNVWIGAHSILLGGATVGDGAIVGAGTVVDIEVPAYTLVAGNPARVIREVERGS